MIAASARGAGSGGQAAVGYARVRRASPHGALLTPPQMVRHSRKHALLVGIVLALVIAADAGPATSARPRATSGNTCGQVRSGGCRRPTFAVARRRGRSGRRVGAATSPPPVHGLRVAVMGAAGWGVAARLERIGVKWDRIDVGDGADTSALRAAVKSGMKALVVYDPPNVGGPQSGAMRRRHRRAGPQAAAARPFRDRVRQRGLLPGAAASVRRPVCRGSRRRRRPRREAHRR